VAFAIAADQGEDADREDECAGDPQATGADSGNNDSGINARPGMLDREGAWVRARLERGRNGEEVV
jgi:hypothetical protein